MDAAPRAWLADLLRNVDEAGALRELESSSPEEATSAAGYLDKILAGLSEKATDKEITAAFGAAGPQVVRADDE